MLYPVFWRGANSGVVSGPVTYTFDQTPTILSGLAGATVIGNTISVAASGFFNGVIQFSGAISSLSVTTNATNLDQQALTFGVDNTATTPEPSSVLAFLGLGLGLFASKGKKQK